ncbi:MAG: precorrin-4 C(11)-methyltransferase [Lachnospiraceae bacterium]|nr:precorrin-4 C(11)-methyltransferase [Lachnospiraceae bacterium]
MVHFVGAGSGAADLITVRGQKLLSEADAVIYAGSLINKELLNYCKKNVTLYDSAELTLEEVIGIIKDSCDRGQDVVRLHSGDPSVYGAIREQIDALCKLDIPFDITPGVTAAMAAAASFGLEYTLPGVTQSFVVTRMAGRTDVPESESIERFVSTGASVAVYQSASLTEELSERLVSRGISENMPVAVVYKASWKDEKRFICTLGTLTETVSREGIKGLAVILIGSAIGQLVRDGLYERSKLYDPSFATGYRDKKEE